MKQTVLRAAVGVLFARTGGAALSTRRAPATRHRARSATWDREP
jgi:hypothetical protein